MHWHAWASQQRLTCGQLYTVADGSDAVLDVLIGALLPGSSCLSALLLSQIRHATSATRVIEGVMACAPEPCAFSPACTGGRPTMGAAHARPSCSLHCIHMLPEEDWSTHMCSQS